MLVDRSGLMRFGQRLHAGFTLVELSIVLSIMAVILTAVTAGGDLYRGAASLKIQNDFIYAWVTVWREFIALNIHPPGDNQVDPTHKVNAALNTPLCNTAESKLLSNIILNGFREGYDLPSGNSHDNPHLYTYQDSDGTPRQLEVCFVTVPWSMQVGNNSYRVDEKGKSVLRIDGLTVELAKRIDLAYDSRVDARHGSFRMASLAASVNPGPGSWGGGSGSGSSQNQIVRAYLKLDL